MIDPRPSKIDWTPPYAKVGKNNKVDYSHGNNIKDFAVDVDCDKTDNYGIRRKWFYWCFNRSNMWWKCWTIKWLMYEKDYL